MKRDMDLVRKIALLIEDHPSGFAPRGIAIEGFTQEQISYHIWLMLEAGLVNGSKMMHMRSTSPGAIATSLTWAGHEFADAARSDTMWNKSMDVIREKGVSVGIGLLVEVLKQQAKFAFGLA